MLEVWFIRHGESVSNANLRTVHPEQSELTPRGEVEARQVITAFDREPDLIVVSPYLRARQTAVPTIRHFVSVPAEEWPVFEFTYLDPKRYRGTTGMERRPYARAYWERCDPNLKEGGSGESFVELLARVRALIARLQQQSHRFIVVFSHGMFVRALIWYILQGEHPATPDLMRQYHRFLRAVRMPNCAICKTQFLSSGQIYVSGFDTSHLSSGE